MRLMQQSSLHPILTPTPCFTTLCLNLPYQKSRKIIITHKVFVPQSFNIVHCYWYTPKPKCADFQAFLNTFYLYKLTFFSYFVGGSSAKSFNSRNVKLPLDACGVCGSACWSANMSSNSRNVKLPFLTNRCLYKGGNRSASWSANMSTNSRNQSICQYEL